MFTQQQHNTFHAFLKNRIEDLIKAHADLQVKEKSETDEQRKILLNTMAASMWDRVEEVKNVMASFEDMCNDAGIPSLWDIADRVKAMRHENGVTAGAVGYYQNVEVCYRDQVSNGERQAELKVYMYDSKEKMVSFCSASVDGLFSKLNNYFHPSPSPSFPALTDITL